MTALLAPNRAILPRRVVENGGAPAGRHSVRAPSATAFVATVILAAVAIVMAATLIATALRELR